MALVAATLWCPDPEPSDDDVAAAAPYWVGAGQPQPPRRNGDEWETDVARPDGSLVEVTLGPRLELLGFDGSAAAGAGWRRTSSAVGVEPAPCGAARPFSGPGRVIGEA